MRCLISAPLQIPYIFLLLCNTKSTKLVRKKINMLEKKIKTELNTCIQATFIQKPHNFRTNWGYCIYLDKYNNKNIGSNRWHSNKQGKPNRLQVQFSLYYLISFLKTSHFKNKYDVLCHICLKGVLNGRMNAILYKIANKTHCHNWSPDKPEVDFPCTILH